MDLFLFTDTASSILWKVSQEWTVEKGANAKKSVEHIRAGIRMSLFSSTPILAPFSAITEYGATEQSL